MRQVQIVLLTALLVALCFVGFELRAINRELAPFAALSLGAVKVLTAPPETREERNERIRRNQQELTEDMRAIWTAPRHSEKKAPVK